MKAVEQSVEWAVDINNVKRCSIFSRRTYGWFTLRFPDCRRGARWIGRSPCCGQPWYACHQHYVNGLPYLCCGHSHPSNAMNWQPI